MVTRNLIIVEKNFLKHFANKTTDLKLYHIGYTVEKERKRKMFKLRVQYLDGQVNDVVADNNTLVLLETMMRYGIIARLTCKLR